MVLTTTLICAVPFPRISSVFFGGGTPSLAQPSTIAAVLETVSKNAHLSDDAEVSLEVNPTPAGKASLKDFMLAGVNRFSIGIQVRCTICQMLCSSLSLHRSNPVFHSH